MREICQSGSEGGVVPRCHPYPYRQKDRGDFKCRRFFACKASRICLQKVQSVLDSHEKIIVLPARFSALTLFSRCCRFP